MSSVTHVNILAFTSSTSLELILLFTHVSSDAPLCEYISTTRRSHVEFSEIVRCLDDIYNGFIALSYATNIPLGCFVMYMLMWPENGTVLYIILFSGFILFMDVFYVVIISAKAAGVCTEVRSLLKSKVMGSWDHKLKL